jgi:hypothetical protein
MKGGDMGTKPFTKSWFSPIIYYSTLAWTIFCFVATWFVILKYGILLKGLFAAVLTFFFAGAIWVGPLTGLILLSLYVDSAEELRRPVAFKEMIQRGMRRRSG